MLILPRRHLTERPAEFRLDPDHHLAQGLVFAGLGAHSGSTHYHDQSLYGRHCTIDDFGSESPLWRYSGELVRNYLDFDGSWIQGPDISSLHDLTISCWWYVTIQTDTWNTLINFNPAGGYRGLYIWNTSFDLYGSGFDIYGSYGATGRWVHLLAIIGGDLDDARLYADGIQVGSTDTSYTRTLATLRIGANGDGGTPSTGGMADVMAWGRKLSLSEITFLANRSDPMLGGLIQPIPSRRFVFGSGGAAPAGLSIPVAMHHYKQMMGV